MRFGFDYQYQPICQKLFKLDLLLKSYKQIKCVISKTDHMLHAYLHLPRTTFVDYAFFHVFIVLYTTF